MTKNGKNMTNETKNADSRFELIIRDPIKLLFI